MDKIGAINKSFLSSNMFSAKLAEARERVAAKNMKLSDCQNRDEEGRFYICLDELEARRNAEALRKHGNDPNIRLDDCGFPKDREDREFLLKHNFGEELKKVFEVLRGERLSNNGRRKKWCYFFGDRGRNKTALATRAIWEWMKRRPTSSATYISINSWINDQMPNEEKYTPPLRPVVLLDDFDKFNMKSEFQVRAVLRLIENLKNLDCRVLITSQYSILEMLEMNPRNVDLGVMLDRVRGNSVIFTRFSGGSRR